MSFTAYVIWFVFMAVATGSILVVGTLGAAGLFTRDERAARSARRAAQRHRSQENHPRSGRGSDRDLVSRHR